MSGRRLSLRRIWVAVVIVILSLGGGSTRAHRASAASAIGPATLSPALAHVGQAYQVTMTFTAGTTWSVVSGTLPPGLALTNGRIGGTPNQSGSYTFLVKARNGSGAVAYKGYTIFVRPAVATGYDTRVHALIQDFHDRPYPPLTGCNDHRGVLNYATAALWLNQSVVDANNRLAAVRISHITGRNCDTSLDPARANLWLSYLIRPYYLFKGPGDFFNGRMTTAAANNLVTQMWAYAMPYSKLSQAAGSSWNISDSENHDAQAKSFDLLAAQIFKNRADYRNKVYADGSTPAQQYRAWHDHWSNYFDERAKRGLFVEVASPTYHGYTLQAILNIYNFAEDPVLRRKAGMILDLDFADFAQQQLKNVWGGAKSRSYPVDSYDGKGDSMINFGNLLFGPSAPVRNNHILMLATSGYYPPEVIRSLAIDPVGKGSFEYTSRRPGVGSSSWDQNGNWHVDPTRSVVNYTYSTPDYILGAPELNPADDHIGPSNQNRWEGIIFNTTTLDRVYPQAAPTSVSTTQDAFFAVQTKNVLITRKHRYTSQPTLVYFPASLDAVNEQSGWLFVKEGSGYLAVRPANGGYTWLTSAKNKAASIHNRFVSLSDQGSPIIFEAARAVQYASFDAFKTDILNNPRSYANGVLNYTASNGTKFVFTMDSTTPKVNGAPISYSPPKVFNSPFMQSPWTSGKITISKSGRSAIYDFSHPANPTRIVH